MKFYLNIDAEEQKKRLQERLDDPNKQWKFSAEDIAERKLWNEYTKAYEEALGETSTEHTPWYIVPANRKWFRDILVASVTVKAMEELDPKYPSLPESLKSAKIQ